MFSLSQWLIAFPPLHSLRAQPDGLVSTTYISDHYERKVVVFWFMGSFSFTVRQYEEMSNTFLAPLRSNVLWKKQKGQALISKEDAPHEGKRERGPTPSVMSKLPLNHFPVKLRSHCEWDKERGAEIGHTRAGRMWLRLSIFFSNWVFGNLGLTGNMVLIND